MVLDDSALFKISDTLIAKSQSAVVPFLSPENYKELNPGGDFLMKHCHLLTQKRYHELLKLKTKPGTMWLSLLLMLFQSTSAWSQHTWDVQESPPTLQGPKVVTKTSQLEQEYHRPVFLDDCEGWIYRLSLGKYEDALIDLRTENPLRLPLHVTGGRNVIIRGVTFNPIEQWGCEPGMVQMDRDDPLLGSNILHRVPTLRLLDVSQSHTSWIEGCSFNANGLATDAITVSRLSYESELTPGAVLRRRVFIINTRVEGIDGETSNDGVHADLVQTHVRHRRLHIENVTVLSSYEGVVNEPTDGNSGTLSIRNYYYDHDPVHGNALGGAVYTNADTQEYDNIFYRARDNFGVRDRLPGGDWVDIIDENTPLGNAHQRHYHRDGVFHSIERLEGMNLPLPDFAPAAAVGTAYVSPFQEPAKFYKHSHGNSLMISVAPSEAYPKLSWSKNDKISSIYAPANTRTRVYEHDKYRGRMWDSGCVNYPHYLSDLNQVYLSEPGKSPIRANDRITSIRVEIC